MNFLAGLLINTKDGLRQENNLMAKYTVRIQFQNRPASEYQTDDIEQAKKIVNRETKKAKRPTSNTTAIFVNDRLKWRKPKEK